MNDYLPTDLDINPVRFRDRSADPDVELERAQDDYNDMLDWWERRYPVSGPRSRYEVAHRWNQVQMRLAAAQRALQSPHN